MIQCNALELRMEIWCDIQKSKQKQKTISIDLFWNACELLTTKLIKLGTSVWLSAQQNRKCNSNNIDKSIDLWHCKYILNSKRYLCAIHLLICRRMSCCCSFLPDFCASIFPLLHLFVGGASLNPFYHYLISSFASTFSTPLLLLYIK